LATQWKIAQSIEANCINLPLHTKCPDEKGKLMDTSTGQLKVLVGSKGYRRGCVRVFLLMLVLIICASTLSAETLMMPERDGLMGTPLVVWGISTLPNATPFTIDFGDGISQSGQVTDRSFIAFTHTYNTSGNITTTLTVGAESATVKLQIFDPALLTLDNLRNEKINMAIQDGLRWLWTSQSHRTDFDATAQTWWGNFTRSFTALVVLAFENQGYHLPNNNGPVTGLYEKYAVRRGLNFIVDQLQQQQLVMQPAGDPCAVYGPAPCTGLKQSYESEGYATSITIMALAGTSALNRTVTDVTGSQNGNFVGGKTYGEILQRVIDSLAWGQDDSGTGRGGWDYGFNTGRSDGSTIGWNMVALLDAAAAGATIPAFVQPEFKNFAFINALNNDGSYDYTADGNANSDVYPNVARAGVGLQAMFYTGDSSLSGAAQTFISNRWQDQVLGGDYTGTCPQGQNKGCAYAMFNNFKGLKLQGVTTLPGVGRPAGPGNQPANDWYADYQDWLVTNQTSPNTTTGGYWGTMGFSHINDAAADAAIAELILSPVALVLPDPIKFATIGLAPKESNGVLGGTHTVIGHTEATNGAPVPGVTVTFKILTGPNAGQTGTGTTDSSGNTPFTYTDTGGPGKDTLQAFVGAIFSNQVTMTWGNISSNLTVNPASGPYGGVTSTNLTATLVTGDNAPGGKTVSFTLNGNPVGTAITNAGGVAMLSLPTSLSGINAGTYPGAIGASFSSLNYDSASATATLTVNKISAAVTPNPATKECATPDPVLTGVLTGFLASDHVVATYTRTAGEVCGNYVISATLSPVGVLSNYTIIYNTGVFKIVDAIKPTIMPALTTTTLWSPDHNMTPVGSIATADSCDAKPGVVISITQNEPLNAKGDGNFSPDASVTFSGKSATINLRSERDGGGDGRVYLIKYASTDYSGNVSNFCTAVTVPKSQSAANVAQVSDLAANAVAACNTTGAQFSVSSTNGPVVGPKQ